MAQPGAIMRGRNNTVNKKARTMLDKIKQLFDLRQDQNEFPVIDATIRSGVRIGGTNMWVLIFAILIASVGLNVNSTAVIIGAMLISPLMRPILGIGYGAAISDYRLIRTAARSLAIFAVLSIVTSTLYFLVSPLEHAQSELLARTTPSLWDVLIAFFGGCAGIIAQTRRDESTIIPGAAIATALMPPLCTAGYGLATLHWDYFIGASYLFLINAFFIALSTYVFVKLMGFPEHEEADKRLQNRAHFAIALAVLALAIPSGFLAYRLVQDQVFLAASKEVLRELDNQPGAILLTKDVSVPLRRVAVTIGGDELSASLQERLSHDLHKSGFLNAKLVVRHVGNEKVDLVSLRDQLRRDLVDSTAEELQDRATKLDALSLRLAKMEEAKAEHGRIIAETMAQYPAITQFSVTTGASASKSDTAALQLTLVMIEATPALPETDLERIRTGLKIRLDGANVRLVQLTPPPAPAPPKRARRG